MRQWFLNLPPVCQWCVIQVAFVLVVVVFVVVISTRPGFLETPETPKAYYDIDDPMCHSREGGLIVWIDVDNWIEVQGSDQEKIAERIARTFVRREKP